MPARATPFDPWTATLAEAQAQPDAYTLPHGAVLRWGQALDISAARAFYEAAPLDGVAACVRAGLVVPGWLARAFLRRFDKVTTHEVGSWDAAFGAPLVKGAHLPSLRRRRLLLPNVYAAVKAATEAGAAVGFDLFDSVGESLGIRRTLAEELYRLALRRGFPNPAARRRLRRG